MALKEYQKRVIGEVKMYLDLLAAEQSNGNRHAALDSWNDVKRRGLFPLSGNYRERSNGVGNDLPTFCVKVPTGGGKTLIATQILGLIYQSILKGRNGAGLVLWLVPSDQIYKDTLKALRDRRHFYRESLEHATSRRLEVWEKQDVSNLTPGQLANNLNVLLLMLPSANRKAKETLKFFKDSGGNIVQHFPAEDEPERHRQLKERVPNLEMLIDDARSGDCLVKTSLANLVRLCEPAVILDEGHKATSPQARETIEGFNPSIVVELSATPLEANELVRVSGLELLNEEMIKLPINVSNSNVASWKDCLAQARDQREQLAKLAARHFRQTERTIRPIVLVQVERTGKDQRDAGFVHSEDAKLHLMERLDVPSTAIAIKSSEKDDIEGIDLAAEGCPIEWIITKSALQEGWDCPYAYVLVSLNNTASQQSMTQLVGRVLRQPDQSKTDFAELNESYVYCLRKKAAEITKEVKKALEKEGYEGEAASVVDRSGATPAAPTKRESAIRREFRRHYRRPFEGKIYLPRFCVGNGRADPDKLDYFRHLLSQVDVEQFDYAGIDWDLRDALTAASQQFYRITLEQEDVEGIEARAVVELESDESARNWLVVNLPFDYFGHKQLRTIVDRVRQRLVGADSDVAGKLALIKIELRERIAAFVERETDRLTEAAFKRLFDSRKLCFYLDCLECRFEIPEKIEVRAMRQLAHDNGSFTERSLFDFVPDDLNEYERSVALFLDERPEVLWWYRNLVGPENFSIQGFRRSPIYPDFVVQEGENRKPIARVMVLETKGKHLKGNADTNYKRSVATYFDRAGKEVTWQTLSEEFESHQFRFQILDQDDYDEHEWRDELTTLLEDGQAD